MTPQTTVPAVPAATLARLGAIRRRPTLTPTSGVLLLVVVCGVLHLLGRRTDGAWLLLGSAAGLALPLVALLLRPRLAGLVVRRDVANRVAVGDVVETTLTVRNTGARRTPALVAEDVMPGHAVVRVAMPALRPGAEVVVTTSREAVYRASDSGGVVRLSALSPVGLLVARADVLLDGHVVVRPARVPVPAIGRPRPRGVDGPTAPVAGDGTEVLGLRPWRPGESLRSVSARASARWGAPVVLEREAESAARLVLLASSGGEGPAWELAVSALAALGADAARTGSPPVLLGLPGPTRPTPGQVLDWCAGVDDAAPLTTEGVAAALRAAGPGGRLVVLAPPHALAERTALRRAADGARVTVEVLGG